MVVQELGDDFLEDRNMVFVIQGMWVKFWGGGVRRQGWKSGRGCGIFLVGGLNVRK